MKRSKIYEVTIFGKTKTDAFILSFYSCHTVKNKEELINNIIDCHSKLVGKNYYIEVEGNFANSDLSMIRSLCYNAFEGKLKLIYTKLNLVDGFYENYSTQIKDLVIECKEADVNVK